MRGEVLNAAEDAAWRQSQGLPPRPPRKKTKKRKKKQLPRFSLHRQGCRRPCDHQPRVPAVHDVREPGGDSDSVHLQTSKIPVAMQRQVPTEDSFTLQVLFLEVVETPVAVQRLEGWSRQCRLEAPQLQFNLVIPVVAQSKSPHLRDPQVAVDLVVDVPVVPIAMPSVRRVLVVGGSFAGFCVACVMKNQFLATIAMPGFVVSLLSWQFCGILRGFRHAEQVPGDDRDADLRRVLVVGGSFAGFCVVFCHAEQVPGDDRDAELRRVLVCR